MSAEGEFSYFHVSGLTDAELNFQDGKLWEQTYGILGGKIIQLFAEGRVLPEYFLHDYQIERHLQFSEQLANFLNRTTLSTPIATSLSDALERDDEHGYDHLRRLEKWDKKGRAKDKRLRSNPEYLAFSPAAFIAIRDHDIVEVYTGEKTGHDGAGGLFAIGQILQSQEIFNTFVSSFTNNEHSEFPQEDLRKLAWAAAFICKHHSQPRYMPETGELLANGLLDPKALLNDAEEMLEIVNKSREGNRYETIYDLFPVFNLIRATIDQIRNGSLQPPSFTEFEIEAIKEQTRMISASDKLDSNRPAPLSADRTFFSKPKRIFYARLPGEWEAQAELEERIRLGANPDAPCDLDRFLFEITRTEIIEGVGLAMQRWYAQGLLQKGRFLDESVGALLDGDGTHFLSPYEELERDMTRVVLEKAGYTRKEAETTSIITDYDTRRQSATLMIVNNGFDSTTYDALLYRIRGKRSSASAIIDYKIQTIGQADVTAKERSE